MDAWRRHSRLTAVGVIDLFGRTVDYLRISVTDRCNLRCVYCLPARGIRRNARAELLSIAEIVHVVEAAAQLGVRRIRLTGGEPLVRPDIVGLVRALAQVPNIEDISLTTNGMLLERLAGPLAEAGLRRVNVSLDTLNPERFLRITRFGELDRVWRGIQAAQGVGLEPTKINTVVVRGVNDDELPALADLTRDRPWHVRFIELMPIGSGGEWEAGTPGRRERYVSVQEMSARLAGLNLTPVRGTAGNGPARVYQIPGAAGFVGFISPIGEHFCATCNRLRLTADGRLRPCLFLDREVPIREALRRGEDIGPLIVRAVQAKPSGHGLTAEDSRVSWERVGSAMSQIGG